MKRQNRINRISRVIEKKTSLPNKWWPTIYCLNEKIFIGVSHVPMKVVGGKGLSKVNKDHWSKINSKFREGYSIDMTKYQDGEIVHCPHCGYRVDFRLWKSSTVPEFLPISLDNILFNIKDPLG